MRYYTLSKKIYETSPLLKVFVENWIMYKYSSLILLLIIINAPFPDFYFFGFVLWHFKFCNHLLDLVTLLLCKTKFTIPPLNELTKFSFFMVFFQSLFFSNNKDISLALKILCSNIII